ncbi:MAG: hypothetical protein CSYNP_03570 [Syntrophus sp. SKADARSKE-3]|nr:hypothetical protein [Syntrophus sp. SKADARSKE-3]
MEFSVSVMCDVFSVSRSGYYARLKRPVSKRKQANTELLEKIRIIHRNSDASYGSPRVYRDLKEHGDTCGENCIARLMLGDGLKAKTKRRFKATTDSKHNLPVAPNLLNREFHLQVLAVRFAAPAIITERNARSLFLGMRIKPPTNCDSTLFLHRRYSAVRQVDAHCYLRNR